MKELIEIETGLGSSEPAVTVRIYATDLVKIAKAIKGKEYIDLSITDGIRRIANIEMLDPEPDSLYKIANRCGR